MTKFDIGSCLVGSFKMTENKRFTLEEFGLNFIVNDNGRNLTARKTVDILNELNNQAEAVREELRLCEEENTELQKENEKLKQIVGFLKNNNAEDIVEVLNLQQTEIWKLKRGVYNVIDNKIEEVKSHIITTPKITPSDNTSNMIFVAMIDLLLDLKKELQEND